MLVHKITNDLDSLSWLWGGWALNWKKKKAMLRQMSF